MKKVFVDAGHGMGNRTRGVFDPGTVRGKVREADINLAWAFALRAAIGSAAVVGLSRDSNVVETPLRGRASRAKAFGASVLVSLHVNDSESATATGTEVWFRHSHALATKVSAIVAGGLGLKNRGAKHTEALAVLRFPGSAIIIELGFIDATRDRTAMLDKARMIKVCAALVPAVLG